MKYQHLHNLIYSDKSSWRWKRHLLFWLSVFLYHMVRIGIMMPTVNSIHSMLLLCKYSMLQAMIVNPVLTYTIVYFLIPKYFNNKKYIFFIVGILLLIILILSYYFIINWLNINTAMRKAIGLSNGLRITSFKPGFIRAFGNPPLIFGLFLSLKTLKNWHLEQLKTETLAKENTNAELQLLKAQVHPHFLFNTLNNIYSFTLNKSPQAGALVQKLSGMLSYMIHDCEASLVPLQKEIKLIQDYIGLEKVRYGNRLDMQLEVKGNYENKMIAPLLMIPFVENCFKHGASIMRGQQWIKLSIVIKDDELYFNLSNSKPPDAQESNNIKKGIGLANVQKRLQLIYPDKHFLKIEATNNIFTVNMQVTLQQQVAAEQTFKTIPKLQPV